MVDEVENEPHNFNTMSQHSLSATLQIFFTLCLLLNRCSAFQKKHQTL